MTLSKKAKAVATVKSVKAATKKTDATVKPVKAVKSVKAAKKTDEVIKETILVKKSLKWNYALECISKEDRKAFRTQSRAKLAKWDKILTSKTNSKGEKISKTEIEAIIATRKKFIDKYLNSNYQAAKQWV